MKLFIHNIKYKLQILLNKFGWHISQYHPQRVEDDVYKIKKQLLKDQEVEVIFDVGAWIGRTSKEYRNQFPKSTIHAFEPFPESFKKFNRLHANAGTAIVANQKAISDEIGTAVFYSNKVETTNSLLASIGTNSKQDYLRDTKLEIQVETETIDNYCISNGIERINILKMDTQGGELKALKGATNLLNKGKIDVIYCEINFVAMYENSPLYHDIAQYLADYGYHLHNIYGLNSNERGELAWGDAIFCSSEIKNV